MRYDAEHKQKTREKVLKEAARAIREDGPDRIAVASVMAGAGLTHGGFYAHFKSKDELVTAAVDTAFDDAGSRFARSIDGRPPAEGMARYIDFYLSPAHRDGRGSGCPVAALAADLPRQGEPVRARYGQGVASLSGKLAALLANLNLPEPQRLAASVLAELVGTLALSRAVGDPGQSEAILNDGRAALKRRLGLPDANPRS